MEEWRTGYIRCRLVVGFVPRSLYFWGESLRLPWNRSLCGSQKVRKREKPGTEPDFYAVQLVAILT
jgi:hypothetical protein